MKRFILLATTMAVVGCGGSASLEQARQFEQAGQKLQEASTPQDSLEAASAYEALLDSGLESGAVYYNLGNAYLQAGQKGRAIAAYQQATRYRPRDPYLAANLANARGDLARIADERSWSRRMLFWQDWVSLPDKLRITAILATIAFALGLVALLRDAWRKPLRRAAGVALGGTLLSGLSLAVEVSDTKFTQHGVIVEDGTVARKGNAETYEAAFTEALDEGVEFTVLERRGDWVHLRLGRDLDGWIPEAKAVLY